MNSKVKNINGLLKYILYIRIALHVAIYYLIWVINKRLTFGKYFQLLKRAIIFLWTIKDNKVVKYSSLYKLHLYLPAYPSRAFFYSLEKFFQDTPGPITVVLSMTKACRYKCQHCYQEKDSGSDIAISRLKQTASQMQDIGVSMFDIEGGEPLLRFDRLIELLKAIDSRSEIWINTTGDGLDKRKIAKLIDAGLTGVMISLHSHDKDMHDNFTGITGSFDTACDALIAFANNGIFTVINCCVSNKTAKEDGIDKLLDLAKQLNCCHVQLIHPKSAGNWLAKNNADSISKDFIQTLKSKHLQYNIDPRFRHYPSVSSQAFEEQADKFGCTAGGIDRFYLGASGEVQPCEFLNISFGNINDEPFEIIFTRMRQYFKQPSTNWLCCTQAEFINNIIIEKDIPTPIPWQYTKQFIASWDHGKPTRLYQRLGLSQKPNNDSQGER